MSDAILPGRVVRIDYTNWRGERSSRTIRPCDFFFGSNHWHPSPQWLLDAVDMETGLLRSFAMTGIHAWAAEGSVAAVTPEASRPIPDTYSESTDDDIDF